MNQLNEQLSEEILKLEKNHHRINSLIENIDDNTTLRKIVKEKNFMVRNLSVDNFFTASWGYYTPTAIIINATNDDIKKWEKSKKIAKIPLALTLVSVPIIALLAYFFEWAWVASTSIPGIFFFCGLFTILLTGKSDFLDVNTLNLNECERLNFPLVKKYLTKEEYSLFLEAFWDYSTINSPEARTYCLSVLEDVKGLIEQELEDVNLKNEIVQEMNNHSSVLTEKDVINAKWGALNDARKLSALE